MNPLQIHLENNTKKTDTCWIWLGPTSEGYGRFDFECNRYYAHRLSYELFVGPAGDNFVCHTCDNRLCVRPDHLFLSDHKGNQDDKFWKNRQAKGVQTNHAILDDEKVKKIKTLLALGLRQSYIARQVGVAQPTISDIKRGVSWKHVG